MKKIAITGNIASGKTILENKLKECGYKTLCLDEVTNNLYNVDRLKNELIELFNTDNKKIISNKVFSDKAQLEKLEKLLHPYIAKEMFNFFEINKNEQFVFVAAPTLFEAGFEIYFDKIVFVSAKEDVRLKRLIERNNIKPDFAKLKINSQIKEENKIPKCDYILNNNGSIEEFILQIENFIKELSTL